MSFFLSRDDGEGCVGVEGDDGGLGLMSQLIRKPVSSFSHKFRHPTFRLLSVQSPIFNVAPYGFFFIFFDCRLAAIFGEPSFFDAFVLRGDVFVAGCSCCDGIEEVVEVSIVGGGYGGLSQRGSRR